MAHPHKLFNGYRRYVFTFKRKVWIDDFTFERDVVIAKTLDEAHAILYKHYSLTPKQVDLVIDEEFDHKPYIFPDLDDSLVGIELEESDDYDLETY